MKTINCLFISILILMIVGCASADDANITDTTTQSLDYHSTVTIDSNTQNVSNYAVRIDLQGTDPTASNYIDFNKANGKVYITDSDRTPVPYWIESWDNNSKTASIWVNVSNISAQMSQYFKFSTSSTAHNDYGLSYPATYEFNIPPGSSNLKAYKAYTDNGSWVQIPEKTSNDFFNGIEAVRFDYLNNKAYVSVTFDANSNDIYLKVVDGNDTQVAAYQKINKYYDNRKAAVVITGDDWSGDLSGDKAFSSFSDLLAQDKLWFSAGIITNSPNWAHIQSKIDNGYLEPISHSKTHASVPYANYDSEIGGSKADIINHLNLPALNRKGDQEYLYGWIEPGGQSDEMVRTKLGQYKYLSDRSVNTYTNLGVNYYATWRTSSGLYDRTGVTIQADDKNVSSWAPAFPGTDKLNSTFDSVVAIGGIYTLYFHPAAVNISTLSPHFDYIKEKNNIWYAGFGHIYLYNFIREKAAKRMPVSGKIIYIYYGENITSDSNFNSVFSKDYGESGLVGLWNMDEDNSSNIVIDSSGNSNNGTIFGASRTGTDLVAWENVNGTVSSSGSALQFDGIDDYVDTGNKASLQLTNKFTLAATVNYQGTSNSTSWNSIINKGRLQWAAPYNGFHLGYNTRSSTWQFRVADNDTASDDISFTEPYTEVYNTPHDIAATFDNGTMKLYIDGVLRNGKVSTTVTNINANTGNLKIGSWSAANTQNFKGIIDNVRVYNRTLNEEEILALHQKREHGIEASYSVDPVSELLQPVIPIANFTSNVTNGTAPLSVQFNDSSLNATFWNWDFGDGTNISGNDSSTINPVHTYVASGTYSVNLTVSNENGTNSTTRIIDVNNSVSMFPVANFTTNITNGTAPLTVQFTDLSENATEISWDFDNNGVIDSTDKNPIYEYLDPGIYTVNLNAANVNGISSKFATINVNGSVPLVPPVANFTSNVTNGTAPLTVQFNDSSENATEVSWDFDNNGVIDSTERNPVYTYTSAGTYTVNLTAANENGTNSKLTTINVLEEPLAILPVANFSTNVSDGSAPLSVQFTDLSTNATEWNWDFGDGVTTIEQSPMHTYLTAGTYTVNLTASNTNGTSSKTSQIIVNPTSVPSASDNVNLSNLTISSGTLTPTFSSDTLTYTVSVLNDVSFITFTPTAADSNAAITVNGVRVTSGQPSQQISLDVGTNTINIEVNAQDGTKQTYTITVTRQ